MKRDIQPDPALAATVRRLRAERGVTQEELAYKADITIASMSRIERCQTNPAWTTVRAIATALTITMRDLAGAVEGEQAGGGE